MTSEIPGSGKRPARSRLRRQFGRPTGWLGALVGHWMARKNRTMSLAAVELLNVQPTDRILEVGFGPGVAIEALAARATRGLVAGIDPSDVMLRQASKRNRAAIAAGRVALALGAASALPFDDAAFDKVLSVNTFQHWSAAGTGLVEVRRVLRPGGMLLVGLRMALEKPRLLSAPGLTDDDVQGVRRLLEQAGFSELRAVERRAGRRMTCVLATR